MILLDTNILIYSADDQYKHLRDLYQQADACVSIISKLEVIGYHKITSKQINFFVAIFNVVNIIPINDELIEQAIYYRQKKSMSVADSIIAASAKLFGCELYTNNVADFKNIKDLKIINPLLPAQ